MAREYKRTVLIVDSRPEWQKQLKEILSPEFAVVTASRYSDALIRLSDEKTDLHVLVTEISLDEKDANNRDGFQLIDYLQTIDRKIPSIVVVGNATINIALTALREKKADSLFLKTPEGGSSFDREGFLASVREAAETAEQSVFLIMPFAREFAGFHKQITDIVKGMGLECRRADDVFQSNGVMESILEEIRNCGIAIADLSGGNPNVYFETGIAHAMGKKVILLTRYKSDVQNNLRALRYLTYEDSLEGAIQLRSLLPKAIKDVRSSRSPSRKSIEDAKAMDFCLVLVKEDEDSQDTYLQIIEPVLETLAIQRMQVKDIFDARDALNTRRARLHSSLFLLADVFTRDAEILYLAGYAYGLRKDVIYLARDANDIPSDLRGSSSIIYSKHIHNAIVEATKKLTIAVLETLKKVIGEVETVGGGGGQAGKKKIGRTAGKKNKTNRGAMKKNTQVKVFINHATEDKSLVRMLFAELKKVPWIDPWLDEDRLLPGHEWEFEIDKAMRESDACLVCISRKSIKKTGYVQAEIRKAEEQQKLRPPGSIYMIPVLLEKCAVPVNLKKYQWVEITQPYDISKIVQSLESLKK